MRDFNATHKTIVIVAFLAAVVALTWTGRDTAALIAVGTTVLAGIGITVAQQQSIKEQANGTQLKQLEMLERQSEMLAKMMPPSETDAASK